MTPSMLINLGLIITLFLFILCFFKCINVVTFIVPIIFIATGILLMYLNIA